MAGRASRSCRRLKRSTADNVCCSASSSSTRVNTRSSRMALPVPRSLIIGEDRLQRVQVMTHGKALEGLRAFAAAEVAFQDLLNELRHLGSRNAAEDLAA